MSKAQHLHWPLIIGLGALALIRPFMNITGMMDFLGRPAGPVLVTVLISVIWLTIVVTGNVRAPLLTLTLSGMVYGCFAIVTSMILSPILTNEMAFPIFNPFAGVAVLATNALWGLIIGIIAVAIRAGVQPKRA